MDEATSSQLSVVSSGVGFGDKHALYGNPHSSTAFFFFHGWGMYGRLPLAPLVWSLAVATKKVAGGRRTAAIKRGLIQNPAPPLSASLLQLPASQSLMQPLTTHNWQLTTAGLPACITLLQRKRQHLIDFVCLALSGSYKIWKSCFPSSRRGRQCIL